MITGTSVITDREDRFYKNQWLSAISDNSKIRLDNCYQLHFGFSKPTPSGRHILWCLVSWHWSFFYFFWINSLNKWQAREKKCQFFLFPAVHNDSIETFWVTQRVISIVFCIIPFFDFIWGTTCVILILSGNRKYALLLGPKKSFSSMKLSIPIFPVIILLPHVPGRGTSQTKLSDLSWVYTWT